MAIVHGLVYLRHVLLKSRPNLRAHGTFWRYSNTQNSMYWKSAAMYKNIYKIKKLILHQRLIYNLTHIITWSKNIYEFANKEMDKLQHKSQCDSCAIIHFLRNWVAVSSINSWGSKLLFMKWVEICDATYPSH